MDNGLRKQKQFDLVYERGAKIVGARVVIHYCDSPDRETRGGFVASKKVGNAVARNRARRLLREAFRAMLPRLQAPDRWFVFVARQAIHGCAFHELYAEIVERLERAGLLRADARR